MTCKTCNGSGRIDALNIWEIQRTVVEHGQVSFDSAGALPMIKDAVRCPECHGSETCDEDMKALETRMGGNPYDKKTYQGRKT